MRPITRALLFTFFAIFVASCGMQPAGMPLAAFAAQGTGQPQYVSVPDNATPTPTPFQPLQPTAYYLPTNTPTPTLTPTPTPTPTPEFVEPSGNRGPLKQPPHQINILLLGSDQRPWDSGFRTDTIVLATLNFDLGTVNLTSFPRDLYVQIPGWGTNRINTAWTFGGYKMLSDTFEANFGVRPDHFVLINFEAFKRFVDNLGGLDVNVAQSLSDYRSGYWTTVPAGVVHMDADDVLWYVRSRKSTNDFARTRRQQEVLNALFEKLLSIDAVKRIPEFYALYRDSVKTDIGLTDIVSLLPMATKVTDTSHIHHYFVGPQDTDNWITYEGAMVLLPRMDRIRGIIRQALNIQ